MSQIFRISDVKIVGSVYLGQRRVSEDAEAVETWSSDSDAIMKWLSDGWRFRFNQFRAIRIKDDAETGTDADERKNHAFLSGVPAMVLQSASRLEPQEWFAGLKRIKTSGGRAPYFKSLRKTGHTFVCWNNAGIGFQLRKLSKRRWEARIGGRNPSGMYGQEDKLAWSVLIRFRASQDVRKNSSMRVNWTTKRIVFVNAPLPIERVQSGAVIGLDFGITHTVATSDGDFNDIPIPSKSELARYKALQRRIARQARVNKSRTGSVHSNRRDRTKAASSAMSAKQARRRKDWAAKLSTEIVRNYEVIAIEDLQVKNMMSKGRGKRGLNRGIAFSYWAALRSDLAYKAALSGAELIAVDPRYTSQRCNACGHISRDNRESQASFLCTQCGHTANADFNAARNILDRALGHWAGQAQERGVEVSPEFVDSSMKSGTGVEPLTSDLVSA